jgi:hypothetical protein
VEEIRPIPRDFVAEISRLGTIQGSNSPAHQ